MFTPATVIGVTGLLIFLCLMLLGIDWFLGLLLSIYRADTALLRRLINITRHLEYLDRLPVELRTLDTQAEYWEGREDIYDILVEAAGGSF